MITDGQPCSAVVAFLYPGYASYKTLSQRPASEEDLEKWLMYWSVLGCLMTVEYVAEWLISWYVRIYRCQKTTSSFICRRSPQYRLPFYYLFKTLFLSYLALPQTSGSSYLYKTHIQPFFATHETEIDSALSQLKTMIYRYLQQLIRSAWSHVSSQTGQSGAQANALDEGGITREAAANAGQPPTLADPISGPMQLAKTLWGSYGPSILASGATLIQQAQTASPPASQSSGDRRKQLEAELASLSASDATIRPYDVDASPTTPPVVIPSANNPSRNSSASSLRDRSGSKSTFEEVEVPSDLEGEGHPVNPAPAKRSSWFGWGGQSKGYERVKTE